MTKNKRHTNYQGFTSPNCFLMGNLNITNCTFTNNTASNNGGGIYINESNPKIYNCTIADNEADGDGDGVYFDPSTSEPFFHNTIIYHNNGDDVDENGFNPDPQQNDKYYYCFIGDFGSDYVPYSNYDNNPEFKNHSTGDYRISCTNGSPCIDAGDNSEYDATLDDLSTNDIRGSGYARVVDGDNDASDIIDIGAYEYEYSDCDGIAQPTYKLTPNDSIESEIGTGNLIIYPNPAENWFSIQLYSDNEDIADIYLVNSVGKIVMEKHIDLIEGQNYFQFERNQLTSGIYFLQIKPQNLNVDTMKLIFK
ncbi:MAG: T9SS type A sorting domain-containing protein [Bacteroidota bacterium]|nr:T9SS type A sorting domain-containing protein [Bacteroidota bacterium]